MTYEVCSCATTADLNAVYDPSAISPTLTLIAAGALSLDGAPVFIDNIVLVKDQINQIENGVYYCTTEGDVGIQAVLSRVPGFITPNEINNSGIISIINGVTQANTGWVVESVVQTLLDPIIFDQIIYWPVTYYVATGNIFGYNSGNLSVSGTDNTGICYGGMQDLSSGSQNTGLGALSLTSLTTGSGNIAISGGFGSLANLLTGNGNVGINGGQNYTGAENFNICLGHPGITGESNTVRIGGGYGTGIYQQKNCYIAQTLNTSGLIRTTTSVTTATYTALATDDVLICNRAGTISVTLLASPETGRTFTIKDDRGTAAANNITITPAAGNIDGAATYVINTNYGSVTLIYNGTQWNII